MTKSLTYIYFFCYGLLVSQTPTNNLIQDDNHFAQATQMRELLRIRNKGPIELADVDGSPYLNENYQIAELINEKQGTTHKYSVRYNAYLDRMETPKPNGSLGALKKASFFIIKMNGSTYRVFEYKNEKQKLVDGYFKLLLDNEKGKLLRRDVKLFQEGKPSRTTFHPPTPAKFVDKVEFYLKFPNQSVVEIPSKKKAFVSLFENHRDKVDDFIKKERLKINNQDDLVKIVKYYHSLIE